MLTDPEFEYWREEAIKRGYASSIALPLLAAGKAFGVITIYSREPNRFSDDEKKLLAELAGDTANGITTIRLRLAQAQAEAELQRERDQLETRVRERTAELSKTNRALQTEIAQRVLLYQRKVGDRRRVLAVSKPLPKPFAVVGVSVGGDDGIAHRFLGDGTHDLRGDLSRHFN